MKKLLNFERHCLVSESQTDLGFSGREAAGALEALVKAGMNAADASSALRSALSLARLEGINTDTAAALLVQTLTMFKIQASESAGALDLISKAADAGIGTATDYAGGLANAGASAANMGISLKETLAALVMLDKTFGSAVESGTYMNSLFKDLIAKSEDLGIELYDDTGKMKSLNNIVEQLKKNVAAFGGNQEEVNKYLQILDVRASRAAIGLINYDGSIQDVTEDMDEARSVQEKVNMVMETTSGRMAILTAEQENVSYEFGKMTAEMTIAWKQFALGLGPIGAVMDALGPSMLQGAVTGAMTLLPQLTSKLGSLNGSLGTAAISAGAFFAAFLIADQLLGAVPEDLRAIAGALMVAVAAIVIATIAWMAFHGTMTIGIAVPIILAAVGAGIAGVKAMLSAEKGAYITSPTVALVGEGGEPEIISPESKLREIVGEGGGDQYITIYPTINIENISRDVDLETVREVIYEGMGDAVDEYLGQQSRRRS